MWLLRKVRYLALHYLDDFIEIEATEQKALDAYTKCNDLADLLGLQLAKEKCTQPHPPSISATWLGFCLDTINMSITLPKEKLNDILEECRAWENKEYYLT